MLPEVRESAQFMEDELTALGIELTKSLTSRATTPAYVSLPSEVIVSIFLVTAGSQIVTGFLEKFGADIYGGVRKILGDLWEKWKDKKTDANLVFEIRTNTFSTTCTIPLCSLSKEKYFEAIDMAERTITGVAKQVMKS